MGASAIVIPDDLMKQLEALSEQEGRPIVDIVRGAMRLYLERHHPGLLRKSLDSASDRSLDATTDGEYPSDH